MLPHQFTKSVLGKVKSFTTVRQQGATLAAFGVKIPVNVKMSASMVPRLFNLDRDMRTRVLTNPSNKVCSPACCQVVLLYLTSICDLIGGNLWVTLGLAGCLVEWNRVTWHGHMTIRFPRSAHLGPNNHSIHTSKFCKNSLFRNSSGGRR